MRLGFSAVAGAVFFTALFAAAISIHAADSAPTFTMPWNRCSLWPEYALTVVTRNIAHYAPTGVGLLNPFSER